MVEKPVVSCANIRTLLAADWLNDRRGSLCARSRGLVSQQFAPLRGKFDLN